jgi:two-component sensor histidine kinase
MASEIVTNAVIHGEWSEGDSMNVECASEDDRITVSVDGPGRFRDDQRPRSAGGFGLALVDALSTDWGIDTSARDRCSVWFEISNP